MKRLFAVLLFAVAALSLSAQPVITGVNPSSAPAAGGTEVVITGSGFATCEICSPPTPPGVFFGGTPAPLTVLVNANTLRVTLPAHLPKTVSVSVQQHNGFKTLPDAFTFTGTIEEAFDRVLLPLFTEPVDGAFGSRFVTQLRVANSSGTEPARLFGLLPYCPLSACIFTDPTEQPYEIEVNGSHTPDAYHYIGRPGLFLYIPKSSPRIDMNLRVFDETRDAFNFGTEMPVVYYDREFTDQPIKLLGVPLDPRFRNTLRVYSTQDISVTVEFNDQLHLVTLRPGINVLDPAYAQFSEFPTGSGTMDVTIAPHVGIPPPPVLDSPKIWAFISVTNNDTQLITTISPQR